MHLWLFVGCLVLLTSCQATPRSETPTQLRASLIDEASGLTASMQHADIFWTHNDSRSLLDAQPNEPLLFAIDPHGKEIGRLWVEGLKPYDWEAISRFERKGTSYLLIGDIGDNAGKRHKGIHLHAVPEPKIITAAMRARPQWSLHLSYPDGARDAEALAVDEQEAAVYILTKRDERPRLYRARLPEAGKHHQTLEFLGETPTLDAPFLASESGDLRVLPFLHQPVDMSFAPDGREVAVLSYAHIHLFPRAAGQSWLDALRGTAQVIHLPAARQYEGISYSADGRTLFVVREGEDDQADVPMLRVERASAQVSNVATGAP